jgi:hypothetical protein
VIPGGPEEFRSKVPLRPEPFHPAELEEENKGLRRHRSETQDIVSSAGDSALQVLPSYWALNGLICSSAAADIVLNVDQEKAALQAAAAAYCDWEEAVGAGSTGAGEAAEAVSR